MTSMETLQPVQISVVVNVLPERAWEAFTTEMTDWWPVEHHSISDPQPEQVVVEPRPGGEIYEVKGDERHHWAWIRAWEPPRRIAVEWKVDAEAAAATDWEAVFEPEGDTTRLTLTHTGWERLGAEAAQSRKGYDEGWALVLGRYERHLES
jgi:uncharacterized protein YndB with AHSA1/START domain